MQLSDKHHSTLDVGRWMFDVHFEANKKGCFKQKK